MDGSTIDSNVPGVSGIDRLQRFVRESWLGKLLAAEALLAVSIYAFYQLGETVAVGFGFLAAFLLPLAIILGFVIVAWGAFVLTFASS